MTVSRLLIVITVAFSAVTASVTTFAETNAIDVNKAMELTRTNVASAIAQYELGKYTGASAAALSAHIDGFKQVEPALTSASPHLLEEIDELLGDVTRLVAVSGNSAELAKVSARLNLELEEAVDVLGQSALSGKEVAVAAYLILLREGLEAVLVLAAIGAFLRKTDRSAAMPYVHCGWIGAIVLGVVTWFAATRLIEISGATREMSEGVVALVAAVMLLYVGFWLHNSANALRWRKFIGNRLDSTTNVSLWSLSLVAFLAVYREVFETVLFIQTLWLQVSTIDHTFVIAGLMSAALTLIAASWGLFRLSIKLPLKAFFTANAVLLVGLAVVFAGKGIMALQEAGVFPHTTVAFPQWPALGIYADLQTLVAQFVIVAGVLAFVWLNRRREKRMKNHSAPINI